MPQYQPYLQPVMYPPRATPTCVQPDGQVIFPCSIHGTIYIGIDPKMCGKGSYGTVFKVQRISSDSERRRAWIYPLILAMKFSSVPSWTKQHNPNLMEEDQVTRTMMGILDGVWPIYRLSPTIRVHDSDTAASSTDPGGTHNVMVIDYHRFGGIWSVETLHPFFHRMAANRDLYVFKLLNDISFVLQKMWKNNMIDRDVHCGNILFAGNLRDYGSTSFIKADYGQVVPADAAKHELVDSLEPSDFCHFGCNVRLC